MGSSDISIYLSLLSNGFLNAGLVLEIEYFFIVVLLFSITLKLPDVVLSVCLGEKENSLKTDDYGRDLSSVQTLLTKQVFSNWGQYFTFCSMSYQHHHCHRCFTVCACRRRSMPASRPSSRKVSPTSQRSRTSCWLPSMSSLRPLKLVTLPWWSAGTSCCLIQPLARRSFWRLKSTSERLVWEKNVLQCLEVYRVFS